MDTSKGKLGKELVLTKLDMCMKNSGVRPLSYMLIFTALMYLTACSDTGSKRTPESEIEMETVSGTIDGGVNYAIQVVYIATNDSRRCKNWALFAGVHSDQIYRYYLPEISNGRHTVTFPRNEVSANSHCGWKPIRADICLGDELDPIDNSCSELYDLTHIFSDYSSASSGEVVKRDEPLTAICRSYVTETSTQWPCERHNETHQHARNRLSFPVKLIHNSNNESELNITITRD